MIRTRLEELVEFIRCVICTGVTLFALMLHLNCTDLSQSKSSNFFHVYYYCIIIVGEH